MLGNKDIVRSETKKEMEKPELLKVKPAVDIYETKDSVVILAEMPNVDREHISVQVKDGLLYIRGTRNTVPRKGEFIIRETRDVEYERIFELGDDLDPDKISASYKYGILEVTIGKKEKAQPKVIEIK